MKPQTCCPFCGGEPWFEGDAGEWQDDSRYVSMHLVCCVRMTKAIGWKRARDMQPAEREAELKAALVKAWDDRTRVTDDLVEKVNAEIDGWKQVPEHLHGAMKRKIEKVLRN